MAEMIVFKRGFFHKLLGTLIFIALYTGLAYSTFIWNPSTGEPYFGLYVILTIGFIILHIPIVILLVSYLIYAFFASHNSSFSDWWVDN